MWPPRTYDETIEAKADRFCAAVESEDAAHIAAALGDLRRKLHDDEYGNLERRLVLREGLGALLANATEAVEAVRVLEKLQDGLAPTHGDDDQLLTATSRAIVESSELRLAASGALHSSLTNRLHRESVAVSSMLVQCVIDRGVWPSVWLRADARRCGADRDPDCAALVSAMHLRAIFPLAAAATATAAVSNEAEPVGAEVYVGNALMIVRSLARRGELDEASAMLSRLHDAASADELRAQLHAASVIIDVRRAHRDLALYCTGDGSPFVRGSSTRRVPLVVDTDADAAEWANSAAVAASAAGALRFTTAVLAVARKATPKYATHATQTDDAASQLSIAVVEAQTEVELYIAMHSRDWHNARRWLERFERVVQVRRRRGGERAAEPPAWLGALKVELLLQTCIAPIAALLEARTTDLAALAAAVAVAQDAMAQLPDAPHGVAREVAQTLAATRRWTARVRSTEDALCAACAVDPLDGEALQRALAAAAREVGAATPAVLRARALLASLDGAEAAVESALATLEPIHMEVAARRCDAVGVPPSPELQRLHAMRALSPRSLAALRLRRALERGDVEGALTLTWDTKRRFFDDGEAESRAIWRKLKQNARVSRSQHHPFALERCPALAAWVIDLTRRASPARSAGEIALVTLSHVRDSSILSCAVPSAAALRNRAFQPWVPIENELRLSFTSRAEQLRPEPPAMLTLVIRAMRSEDPVRIYIFLRAHLYGTELLYVCSPTRLLYLLKQVRRIEVLEALRSKRAEWAAMDASLGAIFVDELLVQIMIQLRGHSAAEAVEEARGWELLEALLATGEFSPSTQLENYVEWHMRSARGAEERAVRRRVALLHTAQLVGVAQRYS